MKPSMQRSIKSAQLSMREINIIVDGSAATPVADGYDASQISEIVDNGAGDYTIILKKPFNSDNAIKPHCQVTSMEAGKIACYDAVDFDRVTVKVENAGGGAVDGPFSIRILGCDHRFNY